MTRTSTGDSSVPQAAAPLSVPAAVPQEIGTPPANDIPQMVFQFENNDLHQTSPGFPDWSHIPQLPNSAGPIPTPSFSNAMLPNITPYTQPSPDMPFNVIHPATAMAPTVPAPLSLTFSDDEGPSPPALKSASRGAPTSHPSPSFLKRQSSSLNTNISSHNTSIPQLASAPTSAPALPKAPTPQRPRLTSQSSSNVVLPSSLNNMPTNNHPHSTVFGSSPDESADQLYEYFPLGLDDWMPPVDAVYRPHVVHNSNQPRDPQAMAVRMRSKRYFSEDMS